MALIKRGACNHCGKYCLRESGLMVENPCIELHEDRCKFYVDELNTQKYALPYLGKRQTAYYYCQG